MSNNFAHVDEVKVGDRVKVDASFNCVDVNAEHVVKEDEDGSLYIECALGRHYLDGQQIELGQQSEKHYVGIYKVDTNTEKGPYNYGIVLAGLKVGKRFARKGWNGKGMFIFLVPGSTFAVNRPPLLGIYPEGTEVTYSPHIDLKAADGTVTPWTPSHADQLSDDWYEVN